jgi:GTP cyclohydrolase I
LQIQERLVSDIVNEIEAVLGTEYPPLGVALIMKGEHLCKTMRGVKKQGQMTSSSLTGLFKTESAVRNEFLQLVKPNL